MAQVVHPLLLKRGSEGFWSVSVCLDVDSVGYRIYNKVGIECIAMEDLKNNVL